jgi:Zn-dependent protease with chaperone function
VTRTYRKLLLPLMLLVSLCCLAQDDPDYENDLASDNGAQSPATLSLHFDKRGSVDASLNLPENLAESQALPGILGQAFHCDPGVLKHPVPSQFFSDRQKNWSQERRDRYRKELESYDRHMLTGRCQGVLAKDALVLRGDFDYSGVLAELQSIGVDQLGVTVSVPKSSFFDYSKSGLYVASARSDYVDYQFNLKGTLSPATLHIAYGLRRSDVQRAAAILLGFIFVPIFITLAMRHRALVVAKTDNAAAWFGFMRGLNWVVLAAMLTWLSTGLGARATLQEWIDQQPISSLQSVVIGVAIAILPSFLIYLSCVSLSYKLHAQLRGTRWTRKEFLAQQAATVGAQALPLMLLLSGLSLMHQGPKIAAALMIAALAVFQMLTLLKLHVMKSFPQPLTTGDLRDRVFALARKLGVSVNQIFIVPAGKGQVANAFAAKNRIVMFTDYLLENLSRREVDGVAAHELAHLRYKHPAKLGVALLAAIFLPQYFTWLARTLMGLVMIPLASLPDAGMRFSMHFWRVFGRFQQWPEKDLVLLAAGMSCFYLLSRHFENVADATAVRLTGDAEAQITGILKVSRLGLVPIRWGKATETWVTHPSTFNRVHRMAKAGGLAPGRLQEILDQYDTQASTSNVAPPEDRYCVPPADDPEKMQVALQQQRRTQGKAWILICAVLLPPALVSLVVQKLQFDLTATLALYLAGMVLTILIATFMSAWLGKSSHEGEKKRITHRFAREKVPAGRGEDLFVGFATGPYPRLYGTRHYWDAGFLVLAKDGLKFVGEQVKFSFAPSEIKEIVVSRGAPSWWKYERLYLRWETADGRNGIFNLASLEPGSIWKHRERIRKLHDAISRWRQQPTAYSVRPELASLPHLDVGQVTSTAPKQLGSLQVTLRVLMLLVPMSVVVSMLIHADTMYLVLSLLAVRFFECIPYWRHRDQIPGFGTQISPAANSRSAGAGAS